MDSMQTPGGQLPNDGYQPMQPGYSPPQKKKGFNWLACCGISCGVLLVLAIIAGIFIYTGFKKVMDSIQPMITAATELESTSIDDIRSQASNMDAESAGSDPDAYNGQWLALEGEVMDPSEFVNTYYATGGDTASEIRSSASQEGTLYMLRGGIMMTDISNSPSKASPGDTVRGYGKLIVIDMADLPWVGPIIAQELGENTKFSFFVAKQVESVSSADEAMDDEAVSEEGDISEGGDPAVE